MFRFINADDAGFRFIRPSLLVLRPQGTKSLRSQSKYTNTQLISK